jgi:hypothetical protein
MSSFIDKKLAQAFTVVNSAFPISLKSVGIRYVTLTEIDVLVEQYANSLGMGSIIKEFIEASNTVAEMRSSYLPTEFFNNTMTGTVQNFVENDYVEVESYENAFMRMVGLPDEEQILSENNNHGTFADLDWYGTGIADVAMILNDLDSRQNVLSRCEEKQSLLRGFFKMTGEDQITKYFETDITDDDVDDIISIKIGVNAAYEAATDNVSADVAEKKLMVRNGSGTEPLENEEARAWLYSVLFENRSVIHKAGSEGSGAANPGTPLEQAQSVQKAAKPGELSADMQKFIKTISGEINLVSMHENFVKGLKKYMIFPICDSRISRCINEPAKIVAKKFGNKRSRVVNDEKQRTSLVESIIRIRLDTVSGVGYAVGGAENPVSEVAVNQFEAGASVEETAEVTKSMIAAETMGILESLLIVRLNSAIRAYAKDYVSLTGKVLKVLADKPMDLTKSIINCEEALVNTQKIEVKNLETVTADGKKSTAPSRLDVLIQQKLIEESILVLFGDVEKMTGSSRYTSSTSNILDLQVGIQRSSSMSGGHLISPVLSVVSAPLKKINSELSAERTRLSKDAVRANESVKKIYAAVGLPSGVGAVDIAVYTLALFSMDEVSLFGLLDQETFDRVRAQYDYLTSDLVVDGQKKNVQKCLNELRGLVIEGYSMFQDGILSNQSRG